MRVCLDLDGTLCTGIPYTTAAPIPNAKELLQNLRDNGHTVILYTARGMGSNAGNAGAATAKIASLTLGQLDEWGFVYDEIYFGKPAADIYVDDKSVTDIEKIRGIAMTKADDILEYRVQQLEKSVEELKTDLRVWFKHVNDALVEIKTQLSAYQVKVADIDKRVDGQAEVQSETRDSISTLRVSMAERVGPGALAGGLIAAIAELIKMLIN